ncbi:PAS domain S-box protein [Sphaerospermopsis aphanizomenoides BCCUSP55]|uniref:PAS domain S-box protein n=1 Tax=Sphaerospermopsis aphanizomenoides TaxID=459663 RepID=UPI001904EB3E|nr:PAS domain S-box protein [Sphaerospermopsis aphanizomenoides]MBK1988182.1 PAS domain S-box protein [Sphaerospermopsis aphanizomenoides BCCUSP55]
MQNQKTQAEISFHLGILAQVSDAVIAVDLEQHITYWNQAAERLYGLKAQEVLGRKLQECYQYQWLKPEEEQTAFNSLATTGEWQGENLHIKTTGEVIHVESSVSSIKDEHGTNIGWLAVIRDITERKQQEERLKESEERLQLALLAGDAAIWDWNIKTNQVIWSDHLYSLFGLTSEMFDGRYETFLNFVHPEDREFLNQSVMRSIHQHTPYELEFRFIKPDGTVGWSACKGKVLYDDSNQPVRMIGVNMDITQRKQTEELLRQSEAECCRILDTATEGVWLIDEEGKTSFVNEQMARMLGYAVDEMLGKSFLEFMAQEQQALATQLLARRKQGIKEQHDFKFRHRDGTQMWAIVSASPIFDDHGQYFGALGMVTDITARKQAEENLQASEQRLQAILDNCPSAIYVKDTQGRHIIVNSQFERYTHLTREQAKNKTNYDLFPANIADNLVRNDKRVLDTLIPSEFEEIITFDDQVYTFFSVKFPLCDAFGKPYAVCGISTDITERKQAEKKIQEQAALIDIATDAIFVRDLENRILFWSQGAERLYGWTSEETLGKKAHELFYRESLQQLEAGLKATIETGAWYGELEQITKTGKKIIVASRWTLVWDESGKPQSILVVNSDITEKKQLEQQFYRAQRLESLGTLASGIAHDLNNVFTPIVMLAQLLPLKFKNVDARTQELFKTLENSSKRGANLVKQILIFARGTEGKLTLLQPEHLLNAIVQVINQTFPKLIEIQTDIPRNTLWLVKADSTQIEQVLMNLVVNARDAMPNGGILKIAAENQFIDEIYAQMHLNAHAGNYVVITVSDTGIGIPQDKLEYIFEPFFTTKEIGQGTGLGLSTVLGIIKSYGGFVSVQSEVGKGTKFSVYLPIAEGSLIEPRGEEELPQGHGELILLVDDEEMVQQTTKIALENYNYKILIANDGIEAIALYAEYQQDISLVLMNIIMPNMDGLTAIRTLRAINPQVKIIATSGLPTNKDKVLAAGAMTFLPKAYTANELLNTLSSLIATAGDR